MKIRKTDAKEINEIVKVELGSGYHKVGSFDPMPMLKEIFQDKKEKIFVATEKNKIIGYIGIRQEKQICELTLLAVLKEYQGKGIGKRLFEYALRIAKRNKSKKIILEVREGNLKAINLYRKQGFVVIGNRKVKKITKLKMEKEIS